MSLSAKVIEEVNDLEKIKWTFSWWETQTGIVLDRFAVSERKTKRHKFQVVFVWSRLDERDKRIKKPVVPISVKDKAIKEMRAKINYESETE
jgi:hypothetical protein